MIRHICEVCGTAFHSDMGLDTHHCRGAAVLDTPTAAQIEAHATKAATGEWSRRYAAVQIGTLVLGNIPAIVTALRQAEAAPGAVEADRKSIARIEQYIYEYEDAPSWGGPIKYPAPPSLADLRTILSIARQPTASPPIEVERTVADGALVLVPREPTEAMIEAAIEAVLEYKQDDDEAPDTIHNDVWQAMIAAAPATDEGERT